MRIIVFSLVFKIILVTNFMGINTELHLSLLHSKIYKGNRAKVGHFKYMSSLMAEEVNFCAAAIFAKNLLLTSGQCAYKIKRKMESNLECCFAHVGSIDLTKGTRYSIRHILIHSKFDTKRPAYLSANYDIGVIMIDGEVDTRITPGLPLYTKKLDVRKHSSGIVSGWGLVNKDVRDHYVGFPLDSSKTLHFGNVIIQNLNNCKEFIQVNDKDLNEGHLCGVTKDLSQRIGWGDVGSPLTMLINNTNYIVGVTFDIINKPHFTIARFIKVSFVHKEIERIVNFLNVVPKKINFSYHELKNEPMEE